MEMPSLWAVINHFSYDYFTTLHHVGNREAENNSIVFSRDIS